MSIRPIVGIVCALLVLGIGAALLLGDSEDPPGLRIDAVDEQAPDKGQDLGAGGALTKEGADEIEAVPFQAEDLRAIEQAAYIIEVRTPSGTPLDGAKVRVWPAPGSSRNSGVSFFAASSARFAPMKGEPIFEGVTRGGGLFPLAGLPPTKLIVHATAGSRSGLLETERPEQGGRAVVEARMAREVEVLVVDQLGKPVPGIQVLATDSPQQTVKNPSQFTNDDGLAELRIDALQLNLLEKEQYTPVALYSAGTTVKGEAVTWAESGVTKAKVTVKRPVTVEVTVVDEEDRPVSGAYTLYFRKVQSPNSSFFDMASMRFSHKREFLTSKTLISGFVEGHTVNFTLKAPDRINATATLKLTSDQLEHQLRIRRGALSPVVAMQFVDEQGQPVVDEPLEFSVEKKAKPVALPGQSPPLPSLIFTGGSSPSEQPDHPFATGPRVLRTDAMGHVRLTVDPDTDLELSVRRPKKQGQMVFLMSGRFGRDNKPPLFETEIPTLAPGAEIRLDPITIPPLPLLVAGRVTDGEGTPLANVSVKIYRQRTPNTTSGSRRSLSLGGSSQITGISTKTDTEGRYWLRGEGDVDGHVVAAQFGSTRSPSVAFEAGDDDIDLTVLRPGGIAGVALSMLAGHPIVAIDLTPSAGKLESGDHMFFNSRSWKTERDGKFQIDGLTPGSYDVTFKIADIVVASVAGVEVRTGEVTRDPRLADLRVGADLQTCEVQVLDPQGVPIHKARVSIQLKSAATNERRRSSKRTGKDGRIDFISRINDEADVSVTAKGYLRSKVDEAIFPLTITMVRGTKLTVDIPGLDQVVGKDNKPPRFRVRLATANAKSAVREELKRLIEQRRALGEIELDMHESFGDVTSSMAFGRSGKTTTVPRGKDRAIFEGVAPGEYLAVLEPSRQHRVHFSSDGAATSSAFVLADGSGSSNSKQKIELGKITITAGQEEARIRYALTAEQIAALSDN